MTILPLTGLPPNVSRGLIIREPWISLILEGRKTWEMRRKRCHIREDIALIRQGSGMIVGTAKVVDCLPRIATLTAYAEAQPHHLIGEALQPDAFERGWRTPWVLADVRCLPRPVPFQPRPGQQDWVSLTTSST